MRVQLLSRQRPSRLLTPAPSAFGRASFLAFAFLACGSLFALASRAQDPSQLKPQGYVNDFANVLSQSAKDQLTALCTEVDQKAQAQIAVVTVKSLGGRTIEDYSIDLATQWGIGPKQKDRGLLILLAIDDHKDRFEVGFGLEGILPDGKVGSFEREAVPFLRQGNYDAAVMLMTRRAADVIAADRGVTLSEQPPPTRESRGGPQRPWAPGQEFGVLAIVLMALFFIAVLRLIAAARSGSSSSSSRRYRSGGWWIGPMLGGGGFGGAGWGGGGFGGGGGGGGGFGGFGGGSFGGGGASGSW
ncbi:MAG TPA: TPM domain-containing protein [Candidatus Acidoferrum sp.]|nr:TPM domain-containing protein [Candidatus Acidoferrum sp.]